MSKQHQYKTTRFPVRYEQDRAVIRFDDPIDSNSILNLCDEIDYAITFYYYKNITVEIDSPGGEVDALHYYIDKLRQWRKKGTRLGTIALTNCCSAAAMMLSLGDLGFRSATSNAALLYHHSRISSSKAPLTSDRLGQLERSLTRTDDQLLIELLQHIYEGLGNKYFSFLHTYKCELPYEEKKINCSNLKVLPHAKTKRLISQYERQATKECGSSKKICRSELDIAMTNALETIRQKNNDLCDVSDLKTLKEVCTKNTKSTEEALSLTWLCNRFDNYRRLFSADQYIPPTEAIAEHLIDTIEE